ncbi:MAG: acyl-CoA/acyl-ACP dehydrogenase [Chloroflexi bacterium]|nr:acyl-CoA/acyl-ACP dehydrogenase [Chloroflexota bacterium]
MDLLLTEEQEMLKRSAREFLEAECPTTLVRAMEEDERGYPPDLWSKMADLGWFGLGIPPQEGGEGGTVLDLGLVFEELGRALAPVPFYSTAVAALTVLEAGSPEQRQEFLPRIAKGQIIMTTALAEHDPRLVAAAVKARATPRGGDYTLTGSKMFVENANVADWMIAVCRTSEAARPEEGVSLLLVDRSSPGITLTPLRTLASDKQSEVAFQQVSVPAERLLGPLNGGWPVAEHMLERATALTCPQMVGAARKVTEMAIEYAKLRTAFGRPIGSFQAIQHMCADMVIWVDAAELLAREALWNMSEGLPATAEVSAAKAFANERCPVITAYANQVHGGISYTKEFDLQLWFRRVKAWELKLGTTPVHREKVAQSLGL